MLKSKLEGKNTRWTSQSLGYQVYYIGLCIVLLPCETLWPSGSLWPLTGQTRSQTIYAAMGLLHNGSLTFLNIFFSVRLTPASSVGSLGAFQSSKAPLYCFWTLRFSDFFFWRQREWKETGGNESQQKQNSTKDVLRVCRGPVAVLSGNRNIDIAALFNCNSLLIVLCRSYMKFKSSKWLGSSNENILYFTEKGFIYFFTALFLFFFF